MSSARKRSNLRKAHDEIDRLKQKLALIEFHYEQMKAINLTLAKPRRVLVSVKGGVADAVWDEGVDVEIFDWDNYEAGDKQGVQSTFADLAAPFGAPVEGSES